MTAMRDLTAVPSPSAVLDRLAARTLRRGSCLEWTGGVSSAGYGEIQIAGRNRSTHRLAWELSFGPIPEGLCVLHTCDNRRCIEPTHLWLGTDADNAADRAAKGRTVTPSSIPGFFAGERNGNARLSAADVTAIRSAYRPSRGSLTALGQQYGIGRTQVARIVRGEAWR